MKTRHGEILEFISEKNEGESKWKRYVLQSILSQLENQYSEVLILYYFEEMKYDEIAEIIGSNKNTVGTLVRRAKQKVKEIVEKDGVLRDALEINI